MCYVAETSKGQDGREGSDARRAGDRPAGRTGGGARSQFGGGPRRNGAAGGRRDDRTSHTGRRPEGGQRSDAGDRPRSGDRRPQGDERRTYGRKPYGERGSYGERSADGERRSYGERKPYGERPSRDRDARPGERSADAGRRSFSRSDRPQRRDGGEDRRQGCGREGGWEQRPRRDVGDQRPRRDRGDQRPWREGEARHGGDRRQSTDRGRQGTDRYERGDRRQGSDRGRGSSDRGYRPGEAERASRPFEPRVPDGITGRELDQDALDELKGLNRETAERVARHLVAALALEAEDRETSQAHAKFAARIGGRIGVVRETYGILAYRAGDYRTAVRELRTALRITGRCDVLPLIADSERGLGRPERALDLAASEDTSGMCADAAIELMIVVAGAYADTGDIQTALRTLDIPALRHKVDGRWQVRLWVAYADLLERADRGEEAHRWLTLAADTDTEGLTDAAERLGRSAPVAAPEPSWEDDEEVLVVDAYEDEAPEEETPEGGASTSEAPEDETPEPEPDGDPETGSAPEAEVEFGTAEPEAESKAAPGDERDAGNDPDSEHDDDPAAEAAR